MGNVNIEMEWIDAAKLRTILSVKLEFAMESRVEFLKTEFPVPEWIETDIEQFTRMLKAVCYAIDHAD